MLKPFMYTGIVLLTLSSFLAAMIYGGAEMKKEDAKTEVLPSLKGATGWFNTPPIFLNSLRGKVVLVDFWTFTCINWRRTLPYITAWAQKYKAQGLVVVGVHTPEFSFEYDAENVNIAIRQMNIAYSVATDNKYDIWNSFQNHYWPAVYLIDKNGEIRYQKFGEGNYEETEVQIQKLLKEISGNDVDGQLVTLQPAGYEMAADWDNLQSPENFLGYTRTEGFATTKLFVPGKPVHYNLPPQLKLNQWALSGEWIIGEENAKLVGGQGKVVYRFHARDLHLIMGPAKAGKPIKFRVLIDGKLPGPLHGMDIDADGNGLVTEQRMYQLVRQPGEIKDRDFQIEFFGPEVEVYDFTFG